MGAEHRTDKRIEVVAYVDYTGSEVLLYHRIENISTSGICIQAPTVEAPGTLVDLAITFPELHRSLELRGEVMWASEAAPHSMGIRFVELSGEARATLERYLVSTER